MKIFIAGFLFLFFTRIAQAQNDAASQQFIRSVIHETGVVYADSLDYNTISEIKKALNPKALDRYVLPGDGTKRPAAKGFTKSEIEYINQAIKSWRSFTWGPGLLDSAVLIKADTITKIFKKFGDFSAWDYIRKHYGRALYSFSKPIFLRNKTICIFIKAMIAVTYAAKGAFIFT